jgi:hypothetical protein
MPWPGAAAAPLEVAAGAARAGRLDDHVSRLSDVALGRVALSWADQFD